MNIIWYGNTEGMYRGWWDMTIFEDFFTDERHYNGFEDFNADLHDDGIGAVVILPARALVGKEQQVKQDIQKLAWCILIVAGDEEAGFDVDAITHPNMEVWVQYPKMGKHDAYHRIGCGYTPLEGLPPSSVIPPKEIDCFFAGQITHIRRKEMAAQLEQMQEHQPVSFLGTQGFAQGLSHEGYISGMARAKTAPCPSGPETPDTFRVYEALELGAVPIADEVTPKFDAEGYWAWLFGEEVPFLTYTKTEQIPGRINDALIKYPVLNNSVQAWWINKKREWKNRIYTQFSVLSGQKKQEDVTIIIPASPIHRHPDTSILEQTVASARFHFPNAPMIITFDGIRPEQEKFRPQYHEHIRRVLWLSREWGDVRFKIFEEHTHQVGMARWAMECVETPLILYLEQDTPLVTDEPIDWSLLKDTIIAGNSNVIRFHFEAQIPAVHEYLMIGNVENTLRKTIQWSQRPHLALSAFYRQTLRDHFSIDARCFIEDRLHGKVQQDYREFGMYGWNLWKVHIYCPSETNIKRSINLDGRGGEAKYDGSQVW